MVVPLKTGPQKVPKLARRGMWLYVGCSFMPKLRWAIPSFYTGILFFFSARRGFGFRALNLQLHTHDLQFLLGLKNEFDGCFLGGGVRLRGF